MKVALAVIVIIIGLLGISIQETSAEKREKNGTDLKTVRPVTLDGFSFDMQETTVPTIIHPLAKRATQLEVEIEASSEEDSRRPKKKKKKKKKKSKKKKKKDDDCSDEDSDESSSEEDSDEDKPKKKGKKGNKVSNSPKGQVFLHETFTDRTWDQIWTYSPADFGNNTKSEKFYRVRTKRAHGKFDYGLITSNKGNGDYAISTIFQPVNSNDAPLVVQFAIQFQTTPHCEYVYLRLFDCKFKPDEFTPDTPYLIQLGPNVCGQDKMFSFVIADPIKGERYVVGEKMTPITTTELHTYTLVIYPDQGNFQLMGGIKSMLNGSLASVMPNWQGYPSVCGVGLTVWHSVLDKFFKGQIIIDDILVTSDEEFATKRRMELMGMKMEMPKGNGNGKEKGASKHRK